MDAGLMHEVQRWADFSFWLLIAVYVLVFALAFVGDYALARRQELKRVYNMIRYHRDQKGHDRCWVDDIRLYELLPEGTAGLDTTLPPRDVFLANCARFHDTRQVPAGCPYRKDW